MNEDKIISHEWAKTIMSAQDTNEMHEVWVPCTRKLTLPEYIEGSARGKIKRENGKLLELKLLNHQEWQMWLCDLFHQRIKSAEEQMKKAMTESLYGDEARIIMKRTALERIDNKD